MLPLLDDEISAQCANRLQRLKDRNEIAGCDTQRVQVTDQLSDRGHSAHIETVDDRMKMIGLFLNLRAATEEIRTVTTISGYFQLQTPMAHGHRRNGDILTDDDRAGAFIDNDASLQIRNHCDLLNVGHELRHQLRVIQFSVNANLNCSSINGCRQTELAEEFVDRPSRARRRRPICLIEQELNSSTNVLPTIDLGRHQAAVGDVADNGVVFPHRACPPTTQIEAARLLTFNAAAMRDRGENYTAAASMAKVFASEMANKVAYQALQIHGGYGYIKEYPVERYYRDARVFTLYEGTSEIQRTVIAKHVIGK